MLEVNTKVEITSLDGLNGLRGRISKVCADRKEFPYHVKIYTEGDRCTKEFPIRENEVKKIPENSPWNKERKSEELNAIEQKVLDRIRHAPTVDGPRLPSSVDTLLQKGLVRWEGVPVLFKKALVPTEGYFSAITEESLYSWQESIKKGKYEDEEIRLRHAQVLFEELQRFQEGIVNIKSSLVAVTAGRDLPLRKGDIIRVKFGKFHAFTYLREDKGELVVSVDGETQPYYIQKKDVYSVNGKVIKEN